KATFLEAVVSTDPDMPSGTRLGTDLVFGMASFDPTKLLVANDVRSPEWINRPETQSARLFNLHSIAYTSLMQRQRVQGLFAISSYVPYDFNPQEIRLMAAAADLTGAALERFRSQRAEAEAREEREQLYQASRVINAVNSFQEILKAVAHIAFEDG